MLFALIIAIIIITSVTAQQNRRHQRMLGRKTCSYCHAVYTDDARFCGQCGRAL